MVVFENVEEARFAATSKDADPVHVQAIIDGDYSIKTPEEVTASAEPTEPAAPVESSEEVVEVAPSPTPVSDSEETEDTEEEEIPMEKVQELARSLYLAEKEKLELAHLKEIEELKKTQQKTLESTPTEPVENQTEEEGLNIIIDDEDADMASSYEKGTRTILKELAEKLLSGDKAVQTRLNEIEEAKRIIIDQQESELKAIQAQSELKVIYDELERFTRQKGREHLRLPVSIEEAHKESNDIRKSIAGILGTDDVEEIECAYRAAVRGGTDRANTIRANLQDKGVKLPDYMKTFLDVTVLDEARNGIKFNEVSGVTEKFNPTLDDIYRLKAYDNNLTKEVREQVSGIVDTINNRTNSATSVLNVDVVETTVTAPKAMSFDEAKTLLSTPLSKLKQNPELASKYADACAFAGTEVPLKVKQLLT